MIVCSAGDSNEGSDTVRLLLLAQLLWTEKGMESETEMEVEVEMKMEVEMGMEMGMGMGMGREWG